MFGRSYHKVTDTNHFESLLISNHHIASKMADGSSQNIEADDILHQHRKIIENSYFLYRKSSSSWVSSWLERPAYTLNVCDCRRLENNLIHSKAFHLYYNVHVGG